MQGKNGFQLQDKKDNSEIVAAEQAGFIAWGYLVYSLGLLAAVLVQDFVLSSASLSFWCAAGSYLLLFYGLLVRYLGKPEALYRAAVWAVIVLLCAVRAMQTVPSSDAEKELRELSLAPHKARAGTSFQYGRGQFLEAQISGRVLAPVRWVRQGELRIVVQGVIASRIPGRVLLQLPMLPWSSAPPVRAGDQLRVRARIRLLDAAADCFSYARYLRRRGIAAQGRVTAVIEQESSAGPNYREQFIRRLLSESIAEDAASVLLASTIGARDLPGEHLLSLFRQTGTTHLIVISGFHVSMIFFLLFRTVRWMWMKSEALLLLRSFHAFAASVGLAGAAAFTVISGAELPAVRAVFVIAVFAGGEVLARKSQPLRSLLAAFVLSQIVWPGSVFEPGCQLTFLAVLGLLTGSYCMQTAAQRSNENRSLNRRLGIEPGIIRRSMNGAAKTFAFCCFPWLFTLPAQIYWFKSFTFLAPVFNFFIIPVFSLVFIAGGCIAVLLIWVKVPGAFLLLHTVLAAGELLIEGLRRLSTQASDTAFGLILLSPASAIYGTYAASVVVVAILMAIGIAELGPQKQCAEMGELKMLR